MSKRKKHTGRNIILSVLIIAAAACAAVAIWQADNIKALVYAKKYSPQQRAEMKKQNDEAIQKIIDSVPDAADLKPLNDEQEKALQDGQLSEDEALQIIMGTSVGNITVSADTSNNSEEEKSSGSKPSNSGSEQPKTNENVDGGDEKNVSNQENTGTGQSSSQDSAQLKKLFARVYLLRSNFTGRLNSLISQAKAEVSSPEAEGNALSIANKYYGMGKSLESECDAQMESLLAQIDAELSHTGGDKSVVGQIRSAYQNEKSLTKSALIEKYKK